MPRPDNGIYIVQGEVNLLVTAMRRNTRWATHQQQDDEQDPLISSFSQLKDFLNAVAELEDLAPNEFLSPFLEVIRSDDTTGPITGLALSSVNKFLSYGLVDPCCETAAAAIENIADAVTHARFVGTDPGSDEVVLMKILHVLRTLLLTPAGAQLTNESVCEIMQSCFRICFEMRLSELLRKSAEHTLMDMVQLLFSRLPQFKEDAKWALNMRKLKMRTGGMDPSRGKKKKGSRSKQKRIVPTNQVAPATASEQAPANVQQTSSPQPNHTDSAPTPVTESSPGENDGSSHQTTASTTEPSSAASPEEEEPEVIATTPVGHGMTVVDIHEGFKDTSPEDHEQDVGQEGVEDSSMESMSTEGHRMISKEDKIAEEGQSSNLEIPSTQVIRKSDSDANLSVDDEKTDEGDSTFSAAEQSDGEYVNPQGVRFMPRQNAKDGSYPLVPYGLPCVRELFRFLISLTNPLDRHNTDVMTHMGLSLLTVALESGADHIPAFTSLMSLVRDDMCKNLFFLLHSERLSLFAASIRVCFLLFEALRSHLKLQLESYITRLMDIMVSEPPRVSYEQREIALESIVQLLRIPGLVTELYLNYDCDLYCTNLFEDLMKLLSKNAFPVSGLFTTHLLSLDALLAVIDCIEQHCHHRVLHSTANLAADPNHTPEKAPCRMSADAASDVEGGEGAEPNRDDTVSVPPAPPISGYAMATHMAESPPGGDPSDLGNSKKEPRKGPHIRPNRMKISGKLPTEEELIAIKNKKRVYQTGTEQFNVKPARAIAYLQEQGLFSTPQDPGQIVTFLKENPRLDKKLIGEYISNKKNGKILDAYQKSFNWHGTRIDEALRMYLETFRLPGEAPVISYILEAFADHWHKTNGEPFANADAAFTLAYAVIMLNVDQHNHNARKQNTPMEVKDFKKNLKSVNGGQDFDPDYLAEIYEAIKYGTYKSGNYDRDLFALVWGPTVAALSFVFDKSLDETIIQKAISGFRKCAMISAHYCMSDVFDNLVISLCKFTTLLSAPESADMIPIHFGSNMKAQLAAKTVFGLAHRHGDILREGWKNILDCMLQLYRAKLIPDVLIKVEDFVDPSGRISLIRDETVSPQRTDTGVFSSFYSYFTLTEPSPQRGSSPEEQEAIKQAHRCLQECHVEQLVTESKFLRVDSLQELLKSLIFASQFPEEQETINGVQCEEDTAVFYLELLIWVILQNRDRIAPFWHSIEDHLTKLIVNAKEHTFLVERAVVGLLRLAIRLLRREDIAPQVLTSLRILLIMQPVVIHAVSRQISYGLHDLLQTNAANIHSSHDWYTLFTLLEVVGAGTNPPPVMQVPEGVNVSESVVDAEVQSDSELTNSQINSDSGAERDYTSDSEIYTSHHHGPGRHKGSIGSRDGDLEVRPTPTAGSWLIVNREDLINTKKSNPNNQYNIALNEELKGHDTKSLVKSCETLAFLVRDAAHVTPHNFESCVHAIRIFVEASLNGGGNVKKPTRHNYSMKEKKKKRRSRDAISMKKSQSSPSHLSQMTDSEEENEIDAYHSISIQLLDLMHTLHTRAATIFSSWAEEEQQRPSREADHCPGQPHSGQPYMEGHGIDAGTSNLWSKCWCPLLQGIARLCCDTRRQVRSQALTYLQRALLVHDLQTLSAAEWESCFNKVLFPLLFRLLDTINNQDPSGIEETRMRASTLLCKVFLQHLNPLLSLSTFTALWLTILDFMDKYMHADSSDLLCEAIPESLKNMLLVMHTAGILSSDQADSSQLWKLTWDRIATFLPNLREEVFKPHDMEMRARSASREASMSVTPGQTPPQVPASVSPQQQPSASPPRPSLPEQPTAKEFEQGAEYSPVQAESPLAATDVIPAAGATYILHPPLPSVSTPAKDTAMVGAATISISGAAGTSPTATPANVHGGASQTLASVPILLNPDIIQGTTYPIISPQNTPERNTEISTHGQ